jgi:hypothetical protein
MVRMLLFIKLSNVVGWLGFGLDFFGRRLRVRLGCDTVVWEAGVSSSEDRDKCLGGGRPFASNASDVTAFHHKFMISLSVAG